MGAMALQRAAYQPRDAEHTVLRQITALHLEAFLSVAAEPTTARLPQFVEPEFQEFLTCGVVTTPPTSGAGTPEVRPYAYNKRFIVRHLLREAPRSGG